MDIIPNKQSRLLYKKGDRTNGIVDLRSFAVKKKTPINISRAANPPASKIVSEIVAQRKDVPELKSFQPANGDGGVKIIARNNTAISPEQIEALLRSEPRNITETSALKIDVKTISKSDLPPRRKVSRKKDSGISKKRHNAFRTALAPVKSFACFVGLALFSSSILFSLSFVQKTIEQKNMVLGAGLRAYDYLKLAGQSAANSDFQNSINNFNSATSSFSATQKEIDDLGSGFAGALENLPINTPVSTAKNLAQAGENISLAGKGVAELLEKVSRLDKNDLPSDFIPGIESNIRNIALNLKSAEKNVDSIDLDYIPENLKGKIALAKVQLPAIANNFSNLSKDLPVANEILGNGRPQKYLVVFENNSEIRATGGFIGTYGILDIEDGRMKNLFINGIFDPDGQLKEKIIPPMPIQKISAAWSMHDSNWFADFPTSAKKIASFYEKTGGPTVDGVIAVTPNVLEKILKITGPIEMPEYSVVVTDKNFLELMQKQVEEVYDKKKNKPKQFLADLAPKIIAKLTDIGDMPMQQKIELYSGLVGAAEESFKEKHILLYHRNEDVEDSIIKRGWGGQLLNSSGDYLSVVNSNINGFKTDAVIKEKITHNAEIQKDGSIIDTVTVTRRHNGGNSDYNWYNRVNSDYMRVYVPLGSTLLDAKGHTVQEYEPPMDYANFKTDSDVVKVENSIKIDPASGTQVFEESGKTVFANWAYVSPQETVVITYRYMLPYKINFDNFTKPADKYSILVQKQSGSFGSDYSGSIKLPYGWNAIWESDNLLAINPNDIEIDTDLKTDKIYGVVFMQEPGK